MSRSDKLFWRSVIFPLRSVTVCCSVFIEIGRTHPIGKVRGGKIQVIARFSTYRQRNLVFSAKRNLKNHKDNVFITENLERKQNHVDFTFRLLQCLVEPTDLQQVQATQCRRRTEVNTCPILKIAPTIHKA
jgi:hypothetical protein